MNVSILRVAVSAWLVLVATVAVGQNGGGAAAGAGQSGFGGSGLGASGFGASGFGGSGLGASGFGASGFGGAGGFGAGTGGFGSGFGAQGAAGGAATTTTSGAATGQRVFPGREAADVAAYWETRGRAAVQRSPRTFGGSRRGRGEGNDGDNPVPPVRVRLVVKFTPSVPTLVPQVSAPRVARLWALGGVSGATLDLDGATAVLTGTVASADARLLAEKLASTEPGVRRVENRLVVASTAEELPPPTIEPLPGLE